MRDLKALLFRLEEAGADPDDTIMLSSDGRSAIIVKVRPGMHQSFEDDAELALTDEDREFLRALRIPL